MDGEFHQESIGLKRIRARKAGLNHYSVFAPFVSSFLIDYENAVSVHDSQQLASYNSAYKRSNPKICLACSQHPHQQLNAGLHFGGTCVKLIAFAI